MLFCVLEREHPPKSFSNHQAISEVSHPPRNPSRELCLQPALQAIRSATHLCSGAKLEGEARRRVHRCPLAPENKPDQSALLAPTSQQMLKLLLVPQKFQGHHSLPSLRRGLIPCKYYDFMGCHGRFSQNPKRQGRHQRQQRCSCPALEFYFFIIKRHIYCFKLKTISDMYEL